MSDAPNILRQADSLKGSISDKSKNVSEVCVSRQKLEDLYKRVLLLDLEYALDRKVEQELWNNGFKNQITSLQTQAKDRQNVKRTEAQATLNLFLEMASGFYLQLLQSICDAFKLDLPFRRKRSIYGIMDEEDIIDDEIKIPKKSSSLYICQYCLVHLGDIARYRQQSDQAETYYWHAAYLIPVNGQPYNQLAILEAARGNKLQTVFYYIRSLALRCPFSVASTNLEKLYIKLSKEKTDYKDKLSYPDFVNAFLQLQAFVHLSTDVKKATALCDHLIASLPSLVTTTPSPTTVNTTLSNTSLLQITTITLYTLTSIHAESDGDKVLVDDLSPEEQLNRDLLFKFIANVLEILLAYTPKTESKARDYHTLPSIKILLGWLQLDEDNFNQSVIKTSTMWPHLAKLLNCLQGNKLDDRKTEEPIKPESSEIDVALPEDVMLRGFQPLEKLQSQLSYHRSLTDALDTPQVIKARSRRLVQYGVWMSNKFPSLLCVKEERNGHPVFTSPIPTVTFSSNSPSPEKRSRQNVAIQAIMQNKHSSPDTTPSASDTSLGESEGSSPDKNHSKYILGMAVNGLDHRKAGTARLLSQNTPSPTLYNAKTATNTKNISHATSLPKKSQSLEDQPIQTSSQNPGLIQIATKDIEKSTTTVIKAPIGPKYYRNIAPRHRNKVPDSLQQSQLEKRMEVKPFCANKESWPALGSKSEEIIQSNDIDTNLGNFHPDQNFGTFHSEQNLVGFNTEPHQVLHSLPQPNFPMSNVHMAPGGLNIVRYPIPSMKSQIIEQNSDAGSHRYSRMNRGITDMNQDQRGAGGEPQPDSLDYTRIDANNSNNLLQQAALRLPLQIQQQSNNITQQQIHQPFPIGPQIFPPQPPMQYPELRPPMFTPSFPTFPISPLIQHSQSNIQQATDAQFGNQQYPPTEFPRKPPNSVTQFIEGPRPGVFPSMNFMFHNPPPNVIPPSQPTGSHMRMYGMDGAPNHLQNGDVIPNNPSSQNFGTIPLGRQTSQGESDKSGTYSLFSGGPWSVHISSAGESKGVSPFMSNGDQEVKDSQTPLIRGSEWGRTMQETAGVFTNPPLAPGIPSNMQSLWSMPGPSPLQRLLEQQRQQRQTDPH